MKNKKVEIIGHWANANRMFNFSQISIDCQIKNGRFSENKRIRAIEKKADLYYNRGMEMNINYLTDDRGNKVAVQIPFREWSELMADYKRLNQYYILKRKLNKSFREIEKIEKGDKKPVSLSGFLNAKH